MPVIYIILITALLTYLLCITTFLLVYVIITGKQQAVINTGLLTALTQHTNVINEITGKMPLSISERGIIE
jgi:hypothetical protein